MRRRNCDVVLEACIALKPAGMSGVAKPSLTRYFIKNCFCCVDDLNLIRHLDYTQDTRLFTKVDNTPPPFSR